MSARTSQSRSFVSNVSPIVVDTPRTLRPEDQAIRMGLDVPSCTRPWPPVPICTCSSGEVFLTKTITGLPDEALLLICTFVVQASQDTVYVNIWHWNKQDFKSIYRKEEKEYFPAAFDAWITSAESDKYNDVDPVVYLPLGWNEEHDNTCMISPLTCQGAFNGDLETVVFPYRLELVFVN